MIRKRKTYNQIILVMGIVIALLIAALIFALSTRGAGAGNTPAELTVYDDPNDALLAKIAQAIDETPNAHKMPFDVNADKILAGLKKVREMDI